LQHAAGSKQHMQQEEITCTEVETIAAGLDQAGLAAHHQASHRHHPHPHPHFTHHPHHYHHQQQESKSKSISSLLRAGHLPQKAIDPISGQTMDQLKRNHKSIAKSRDRAKNHLTIPARSAGSTLTQKKKNPIYLTLIRKLMVI